MSCNSKGLREAWDALTPEEQYTAYYWANFRGEELDKLLKLIPPCPQHGEGCTAHAKVWIEKMREQGNPPMFIRASFQEKLLTLGQSVEFYPMHKAVPEQKPKSTASDTYFDSRASLFNLNRLERKVFMSLLIVLVLAMGLYLILKGLLGI